MAGQGDDRHHIVRNNTIHDCEQTASAAVSGPVQPNHGNHIYNIWAQRLFSGAEMAGIKIHASIDLLIQGNRLHHTGRSLWMDWMAQGTRITGTLLRQRPGRPVRGSDHGPFLVDNNSSFPDQPAGHVPRRRLRAQLMTGRIVSRPEPNRVTPYHPAHSTAVAGLVDIKGGDNRFYNNLLVGKGEPPAAAGKARGASGFGLWVYDNRPFPRCRRAAMSSAMARAPMPAKQTQSPCGVNPKARIVDEGSNVHLHLTWDPAMRTPTARW